MTGDQELAGHRDGVVLPATSAAVTELALSSMVAHVLNNLDHPVDGDGEPNRDFVPCDPDQCAPCQGLYSLQRYGLLSLYLRPYVRASGGGWDWWDEENDWIDWDWVTARTWPGAQGV